MQVPSACQNPCLWDQWTHWKVAISVLTPLRSWSDPGPKHADRQARYGNPNVGGDEYRSARALGPGSVQDITHLPLVGLEHGWHS